MKQNNLKRAVKNTASVLAALLLIGLFTGLLTGCPQKGASAVGGSITLKPIDLSVLKIDENGAITGYTCNEDDLHGDLIIPGKMGRRS